MNTGPVLRMKSILLPFGGRGWRKRTQNFRRLSALWNLGFGLVHVIYQKNLVNCSGVLMSSKNYCFCKTVTLHVEIGNTFCRRTFAGKSIPRKSELNKQVLFHLVGGFWRWRRKVRLEKLGNIWGKFCAYCFSFSAFFADFLSLFFVSFSFFLKNRVICRSPMWLFILLFYNWMFTSQSILLNFGVVRDCSQTRLK